MFIASNSLLGLILRIVMFRKSALILATTMSFAAASASAATILFNDFSSSAGLQLNGSAATATDSSARKVLRVTPAIGGQSGSAFSTSAVTLGGKCLL